VIETQGCSRLARTTSRSTLVVAVTAGNYGTDDQWNLALLERDAMSNPTTPFDTERMSCSTSAAYAAFPSGRPRALSSSSK
jgi:hypothetical protein